MILAITLTPEDIIKGKAHNCESCPIALAISRKLKDGNRVHVYQREFHVFQEDKPYYTGGMSYKGTLPQKAIDFIFQYDSHDTVEVIDPFELDIPDGYTHYFI